MDRQLAQADVGSLTVPGKYRFGPSLYLQVSGPNAKSWFYRYTVRGKERFMGLGSARDVTLAQARKRVDELRITRVSKKIDPLVERKAIAEAERAANAKAVPFRTRAEQYIVAHEGECTPSVNGSIGRNRENSDEQDKDRLGRRVGARP